ncbi:hypothetical protein HY04_01280 [Kaistella antarctica]|nr:hypothetical protein HY04_01280 [Kaistella antarctica]
MNINVGENMTTNVGMNSSEMIRMKNTQTVGMNATQSIGAMKMTSVLGDASMFITGKLMEIIEGDVHSETKQGKTTVNSDKGIETSSQSSINRHAQEEVQHNSGENLKTINFFTDEQDKNSKRKNYGDYRERLQHLF